MKRRFILHPRKLGGTFYVEDTENTDEFPRDGVGRITF